MEISRQGWPKESSLLVIVVTASNREPVFRNLDLQFDDRLVIGRFQAAERLQRVQDNAVTVGSNNAISAPSGV